MTTIIEYALLAGDSYYDTRADINRFPIPKDWGLLSRIPESSTTGFEASAYRNSLTNEIVISFAGTDFSKGMPGAIFTSDFWQGNIPLVTGTSVNGADQLVDAVEYYLQVKAANPTATITLTGHSLGGSLAALVGVFFGETAFTFDQVPGAATAMFAPATLLRDALLARGHTATELAPLNAYITAADPLNNDPIPADTLAARAASVTNLNVQGEVAGNIPFASRIGSEASIDSNHPGLDLFGNDLHSIALLTTFLQSYQTADANKALNDVTFKLTDLLGMIFDKNLFAHDTDTTDENFLERLVKHQAGIFDPVTGAATLAPDAMVTRFNSDLWKLAQDGGLTMTDWALTGMGVPNNVGKTLIAFAMQKYYEEQLAAGATPTELFTAVTGGIRFDMADVSATFATAITAGEKLNLDDAKGYKEYFQQFLTQTAPDLGAGAVQFTAAERQLMQSLLPYMHDWYVQAGASGMNATDTLNRGAFMLGGNGSDALVGGTGADLLVGNAGEDLLQGGLGNDFLLGGTGNDAYVYTSGDGLDTLLDTSGQNTLAVDGVVLDGGAEYGDDRVHRDANGHLYVKVDQGMVIDGNIVIQNYGTGGTFGLAMTGAAADVNPTTDRDIFGDLAPLDTDPAHQLPDGLVHAWTDTLGNLLVGAASPDRADTLYDSTGNDRIISGGGADYIYATRGGDNLIEAGAGRDSVSAGAGKDVIIGGADGDILDGGDGNDRLYADTQTDNATTIANGNLSNSGSGLKGDWLAGGAGDDTLIGSTGNDVLSGGGGADLLIAGAGDDDILADLDWVASSFNWTVTDLADGTRYFYPANKYPATGAADVIYAGEGNDHAWGGIGNDVIFGEGGADKLYGEQGNDTILGGAGADWLYGDGGNSPADTAGNDYLDGGTGDDFIYGNAGDDILIGGKQNDFLNGGAGADTYIYNVGDGIDHVYDSKAERNILRFGAGVNKDNIKLHLGSLLLDLGNGDAVHIDNFDRNDVFNSSSIGSFEFADGGTLTTTDLLARGFDIDGTEGDDTATSTTVWQWWFGQNIPVTTIIDNSLYGTNTTDRINGLGGNDTLVGEAGDDVLDGGTGNDSLNGGTGDDMLIGGVGDDKLYAGAGTNTLDGGEGNDILNSGGPGSSLFGGAGNDDISAGGGGNTLDGGVGVDTLAADGGSNTLIGGLGDDTLSATGGSNHLDGGDGTDTLIANGGNNTLLGGAGDDTLFAGAGGGNTLNGGDGMDWYVFDAGFGEDHIADSPTTSSGQAQVNTVQFNFSFAGAGIMLGLGLGSLKLSFANHPGDMLHIDGFDANDPLNTCVITTFAFTDRTLSLQEILDIGMDITGTPQADFIQGTAMNERINALDGDDTILAGGGNDVVDAGAGNDYVDAGDGNDIVNGGAGNNTLLGGAGNDTYIVAGVGDAVTERLDEGVDNVESSITYTLTDNVENLTLTGIADINGTTITINGPIYTINGTGNALDNVINGNDGRNSLYGLEGNDILNGNAGNDILDGGLGADTMTGGAGSDTYVVDNIGDIIVEGLIAGTAINSETDVVQSSITYTLTENVEVLTLTGVDTIDGTGNMLTNTLQGNSSDNRLYGLGGVDYLYGNGGNDLLDGGDGADQLRGGSGDDVLMGGVGNDYLEGGGGIDMLLGGDGDDFLYAPYAITDASEFLDGGNGNDRLVGGFGSDTLSGGAGNDTLIDGLSNERGDDYLDGGAGDDSLQCGNGNDTLLGGAGADYLFDRSGNNHLDGGAGNDELYVLSGANILDGGDGNDQLYGGSGNDYLNGGAGNDTMYGGTGDDTYVVDSVTDVVIEYAAGGIDIIQSSVSYTLSNSVENLTLAGMADINATGNALDNILTSNNATNVLDGGAGADTLIGGQGNDTLLGGAGNDRYVFNSGDGADTIVDALGSDTIFIGGNLTETNLEGVRDGDNMIVQLPGTTDSITLTNWFVQSEGVNRIEFGDGSALDHAGIAGLLNRPPVANPDAITVFEDGGVLNVPAAALLANDTDPNVNDTLSVVSVGASNVGATVMLVNGQVQYDIGNRYQELGAGQTVMDSFGYTISDNKGATASSVVNVTITGTNDAPVTATPIASQQTNQDAVFSFTVPANTFTDIDTGDVLSYSATLADNSALPSWLTFDAATQTFSGTPANGDVGSLSLSVTASDGSLSASSTFALDVINVNDTPTANVDSGSAVEDGAPVLLAAAFFLANDTDPDFIHGDVLHFASVSQAGSGAAVTLVDGNVQYDIGTLFQSLALGQSATDSFSYTVIDTAGATSTATVTMTIAGANDAAVTANDAASAQEDVAVTATGNVLTNDNDVDQGTVLTVANASTLLGSYGSLVLNADGGYTYALDNASLAVQSLAAGQTVTEAFGYQATDGLIATPSNLAVTITGTNDAPLLVNALTDQNIHTGAVYSYSNYTNCLDAIIAFGDFVGALSNQNTAFSYQVPADAFADIDSGDSLTYSATLSDGTALPSWMAFDPLSRTFSGTPTIGSPSNLDIQVIATDIAGATASDIFRLSLGATINGGDNFDILVGTSFDDTLNGGMSWDLMVGGSGNDIYVVDNAFDVVLECANEGFDTVQSKVTYTLGSNLENLTLTGTSAINGTGNTLDNVLLGNAVVNTLKGGSGNDLLNGGLGNDILKGDAGRDVLEGADGNDALNDTGGNNLFNGGAGTDTLTGNTGKELFIGGSGNDTITTGTGADIIAFNRGDGQDTVAASSGADNTISLGGGIGYQSLAMSKSGNNLILNTGNGDQINLQNWFASTANRSVLNLQIVLDNMTYNPASLDMLVNQQVQRFDFAALANDFDQALAADPTLTAWSMTDALLTTHLAGSDTEALGSDLAYQYNLNSSLAGIGVASAQAVLGDANFGVAPQLLQPLASLQTGAARLG